MKDESSVGPSTEGREGLKVNAAAGATNSGEEGRESEKVGIEKTLCKSWGSGSGRFGPSIVHRSSYKHLRASFSSSARRKTGKHQSRLPQPDNMAQMSGVGSVDTGGPCITAVLGMVPTWENRDLGFYQVKNSAVALPILNCRPTQVSPSQYLPPAI